MSDSASHVYALMLRGLAEPALRALVLAALAGLALGVARVKDAALRMAVWTAVLYAALAMPFLARVAPAVRLPMPDFLAARNVPPAAPMPVPATSGVRIPISRSKVRLPAATAPDTEIHSSQPAANGGTFSWPLVAAFCYLLIAGTLLAQVAVGFFFSRRVKLSSRPVGDQRALAALLEQSTRGGLQTAPKLAESPAVAVPVTLGVWHPVVLLPAAWREWSEEKLQAVLAHELSHVVRRDALTRALAALHRSVFWFSPLAWWLEAHLAALAEQASDDAALGTVADRVFYANVLLGFYQDLQGAAGRVRWEGVAMTSGKQAQRRVERILDSSRRLSAGLRKPAGLALALMAAPVIYLLAGAQPVSANKLHIAGARVPAAALTSFAAGPLWAEMQAPPPAPVKPAPPAPRPPALPRPEVSESRYGDAGEPWMFTSGEDYIMGGYWRDNEAESVKALRQESSADFIWFRRNGKAYLIRDAATVQQAKAYWAPQEALGKQQDELGRQQEALGDQQEELGKQMEQVRVEVPDLTAKLQKVQAQLDQLHKRGATQEELGDLQGALGDLQGDLGEIQGKAGEKQGEIGAKQGELGERQGRLGEQQGKLGEEQGRLAEEASRKMRGLLDNALAKGLAQPQ